MLRKNVSGQWLYFVAVSALSGNPVASIASGNISGRVSLDGGVQAVLAGPVVEVGGGQYQANLFAADTNGGNCGYLFTMSGCVPVSFTVITTAHVSGTLFPNSGLAVNLLSGNVTSPYSGQMSGQLVTASSGVFGTTSLNSGQFVNVYSGQLSGQQVNLHSGNQTAVVSGTFTTPWSGRVFLASGVPALDASGAVTVVTNLDKSGYTADSISGTTFIASGTRVNVYSGQLSGQSVALLSGQFSKNNFASGVLAVEIPQAVHTWNYSGAPNVSGRRCLLNAERKLVNKWDLATSGKLTVYEEDDTTIVLVQNVSSASGAAPVTGLDSD